MKKLVLLAVCFFVFESMYADIRLPNIISSGMVLQQQATIKLWGWSAPAEKIYVTTSWNNKTDSVKATRNANWQLQVQTPAAGGPYTITFKGQNTVVVNNILIGEVWVCSGQSNMEMHYGWGLPDIKAELPTCANNGIRFFYIPKTTSATPQDDCVGKWVSCDSNTLKTFSAVGYFFGKKLNNTLNFPVGLINANWGGTPAEVWAQPDAVNNDAELAAASAKLGGYDGWPKTAGAAYNGMIAPITNYNIAGAIWYQGESNTGTADTYAKLLTTLIGSWRKAWNKDFPFYYVQIAPYTYGDKNISAALREQQTKAMAYPKTGMVVITDLVDNVKDIHPKNKHDIGYRLANWALAETYHTAVTAYKSPVYKSIEMQKDKAVISFDNAPNGLMAKDKVVTEMYIAGNDKIFYPATTKVNGSKLIVTSKQVPMPVAVRFGFSNTAMPNLFSKEGLPVNPFRTDDWELDRTKE